MAIRRFALSASRFCGAQRLFRFWSRGPTVLFYHGVEENIVEPEIQALHMPLRIFERQVAFLRRNREVISMDYLDDCIARGSDLDPRHVVLTFDDGYKNNMQVVAPLLEAWKLPFTIFVSTKHVSEGCRFPIYYIRAAILFTQSDSIRLRSISQTFNLTTRASRSAALVRIVAVVKKAPQHLVEQIVAECKEQLTPMRWADLDAAFSSEEIMSWKDVRRASEMGATIGSHCHDHCILHSNQSREEVCRQLNQSKSTIEKHVATCRYMAYPNGKADDISSVAYSAARSAEFGIAFTSIPGEVTTDVDRFFAPRLFAVPEYEEFCYLLNRSSMQNQVYAMARLRGEAWVHQAAIGLNG
jgi:peptidoglycan/xylan/chitin deacetylase (PgdA/CDA1 family)